MNGCIFRSSLSLSDCVILRLWRFYQNLGYVWYQSCVPSAFNRQGNKPSGPHSSEGAWGKTEESLSVSNSIFLHNVLGLSGACLINFIYSSASQSFPSLFFYIHFIISLLFFLFPPPHPSPSGPGQWNTFRRSRGQAAVDEEEEVKAGQCCGSKGQPLSQVYDQSQVHRCLHPRYVREWSCGHNGPWPGKAKGQWVNILYKR